MTAGSPAPVAQATAAAFRFGSASKSELLTAAVAARAGSAVLEQLLRLPEGRYFSASQLSRHLAESRD